MKIRTFFLVFGLSISSVGAIAQEAPPGTFTPATDAQGYYTSPLPPPPQAPMDYGGQTQPVGAHSAQTQEAYNPPPVSYSPPPTPSYDPIPQVGTNTFANSKFQRPEKRKRYHRYSPYTDVVMMIRAQDDPNIAEHIAALREDARRRHRAAQEQRALRRAERRQAEISRREFVRERFVLQPMDPAEKRAALRKHLEEKRRYREQQEGARKEFVKVQRARRLAQRELRMLGRQRLLAFQRGELTRRQGRAIASPESPPNPNTRNRR